MTLEVCVAHANRCANNAHYSDNNEKLTKSEVPRWIEAANRIEMCVGESLKALRITTCSTKRVS